MLPRFHGYCLTLTDREDATRKIGSSICVVIRTGSALNCVGTSLVVCLHISPCYLSNLQTVCLIGEHIWDSEIVLIRTLLYGSRQSNCMSDSI